MSPDVIRPTEDAFDLITRWEGWSPTWYEDPVGVATIGYGFTEALLNEIRLEGVGGPLTKSEGRALLGAALRQHYGPKLARALDVTLPQRKYDALLSFVYNVGISAFDGSTMHRLYNKGEEADAEEEYLKWVYADGEKLPGLVERRKDEKALAQRGELRDVADIDEIDPVPTYGPEVIETGALDTPDELHAETAA